ncbi:MAG: hypothetical protein ACLFTZ_03640 [Acholeplasmataceae bacterium]
MAVNYMGDFDIGLLENYDPNGSRLPSPDQYVGKLSVKDHYATLSQEPRDSLDYSEDGFSFLSGRKYAERNICVILESPHRLEYDALNRPIALVMGKTGCLFFSMFAELLSESRMPMKDGTYNVILTNAVQYQASCGLNPIDRSLRDRNWLEIYERYGGEMDLKKRIFAVKPRYTINLCTGGKNPNGLRHRVSESLDRFGLIKGSHYTEGNHPASWDFQSRNVRVIL